MGTASKQQKQVHPQQSFRQLVAEATLDKLSGYIDAEVDKKGRQLAQQQRNTLENLYTRVIATEDILLETVPGLTKDALAERVAGIQDKSVGLEKVDVVEKGDRVRIEIKTKTVDQAEYQGSSRLMIENVGQGETLGELENGIIGMKTGETRELKFGKDDKLTALITLNRSSRTIVQATKAEDAVETKSEEVAAESSTPAAEDVANDSNAG